MRKLKKIKYLGFVGVVKIAIDYIISAAIIKVGACARVPFSLRNIGKLEIGENFRVGQGLIVDIMEESAVVKIGKNFRAASRLHIGCINKIEIGDNVLIASDVHITDHSHGQYSDKKQSKPESIVNQRELIYKEVIIGNNVWIGEKVFITRGVRIGDNSIIGAYSLVKNDVESNSIVVGIPAKMIKKYNDRKQEWCRVN
jgi:lipopolysaccharide O-acetyltransferase